MWKIVRLTIGVIMHLLVNHSVAQGQEAAEPVFKHAVGAGAGFTTGYGISYRFMPAKYGVQLNFAPYRGKDTERYSAGLTLLYKIIENRSSSLYLYQGNHYYYHSYNAYVFDPATVTETKQRQTEKFFNNGVGFGVELIIAKRVGFNLMAGYAAYDNFSQLNVTGETALYYKF